LWAGQDQELDLRIGTSSTLRDLQGFAAMASSSRSPLGPRLRQARIDAGLTQAELAERAGVADATLSRIERSRLVPSIALTTRIAAAIGMSVDALVATSAPSSTKARGLRRAETKLLATVRDLDESVVDDINRGLRLIMAAARRSARKGGAV
jgi:transcriptional regulator with XRE-family HTH domain